MTHRHIDPQFSGSELRKADSLAGDLTLQPAPRHRQTLRQAPGYRLVHSKPARTWPAVVLCVICFAAIGVMLALGA